MTDSHCDQISQLTPGELDRYAAQLARCLKALATTAPIRAHVQDELAAIDTELATRAARPARPAATLQRSGPDPGGSTTSTASSAAQPTTS